MKASAFTLLFRDLPLSEALAARKRMTPSQVPAEEVRRILVEQGQNLGRP